MLFILFGWGLSSCTYRYFGPNDPIFFHEGQTCAPAAKGDVQFHTFVAIVHSMDVRKWLFIDINRSDYRVAARVGGCMYPTGMTIVVSPTGKVTLFRSNPVEISRAHARRLSRWIDQLEKTFYHYRCQTTASLLSQVDKYWIKPRLLPHP
jgi:hypothetical protein